MNLALTLKNRPKKYPMLLDKKTSNNHTLLARMSMFESEQTDMTLYKKCITDHCYSRPIKKLFRKYQYRVSSLF